MASPVPPHAAARPPEDEHGVLAAVQQQLLPPLQHPLEAGVSHDAQTGAPADVLLVACAGSVIHSDDALRAVDFVAPHASGQLAGAGHQGTRPAVHV